MDNESAIILISSLVTWGCDVRSLFNLSSYVWLICKLLFPTETFTTPSSFSPVMLKLLIQFPTMSCLLLYTIITIPIITSTIRIIIYILLLLLLFLFYYYYYLYYYIYYCIVNYDIPPTTSRLRIRASAHVFQGPKR